MDQKSDKHGQPSTINPKSPLVQCPQCLNGSELFNNRTGQDLQSSTSGLSTNVEKAQHTSEKESIILCSEHRGHVINPTCDGNEQDNIVTSSNNDSDFENVLDELKVSQRCGDKKRSFVLEQQLENMKGGDQEPQQPHQVEDQNQNTSGEDA